MELCEKLWFEIDDCGLQCNNLAPSVLLEILNGLLRGLIKLQSGQDPEVVLIRHKS